MKRQGRISGEPSGASPSRDRQGVAMAKVRNKGRLAEDPMTVFPPDLVEALKAMNLADFFAGCTRAHQSEYLKWIAEAKRSNTRAARIAKTVQMLAAKRAEEQKRANAKT